MKKAFTMLELVFVIVVVGILSYFAASGFQRNPLREAADQVVSHIRYTQHLAMEDDRFFDPKITSPNYWPESQWQISFSKNDNFADNMPAYLIFRDLDNDGIVDISANPLHDEIAKDPANSSNYLTGGVTGYSSLDIRTNSFKGTEALNLGKKYGITDFNLTSTCSSGTKIAFDYLGRPIRGPLTTFNSTPYPTGRLIVNDCNITLISSTRNITITIQPETGYTYISSQNY